MDKLRLRSVPYHKKNSWGEEIYSTLLQHTWLMEETKIICMVLRHPLLRLQPPHTPRSSGSWASREPWPECSISLLLRQFTIFPWYVGFTAQKWHWPISLRTEECCDRKGLNKIQQSFSIFPRAPTSAGLNKHHKHKAVKSLNSNNCCTLHGKCRHRIDLSLIKSKSNAPHLQCYRTKQQ